MILNGLNAGLCVVIIDVVVVDVVVVVVVVVYGIKLSVTTFILQR